MKILNIVKKIGMMLSLSFFSLVAFADEPAPPPVTGGDDTSISNLSVFHNIINNNAGTIFKITIVVATLAGLILIIRGLVLLKQNYTGAGGQEKYLSKGIASLGFGTALILAVPLSHTLVGSISVSTTFTTGAGTVSFGDVGSA